MMLRTVIIDDEPLARKGLKEYVQDMGFLQLVGEFDNPVKAMDMIMEGKADLVFLDIEMPKMTGLEFMRSMALQPMVILTTAWPQYAVEGFELNAVDYLVKPFSFDRFCKAVMKARKLMPPTAEAAGTELRGGDYFFIKSEGRLVRIELDEILFVEALQNYVAVQTVGQRHITYLTFHGIAEYLPAGRFVRTHKSFMVAAGKVESIEGNEIRIGAYRIPISRTERESVFLQITQNRMPRR